MSGPVRKKIRLGELLVEQRALTDEQLRAALAEQKRSGRKLGRVLTDLGFLTENALHEFLARHLQVPFIDLKQARFDAETVRLLPETQARRYRAIVLQKDARGLLVGMADPTDLLTFDELQSRLKLPLRLALVSESALLQTLDAVYHATDQIASLAQEVREDLRDGDVDVDQLSAEDGSPDAPVIRLLQTMFHEAVRMRASDIHIEPGESALRIRQRIDGMLQEQVLDGRRVAAALVTRLKLMCGLDIAEKRLPQDGRFTIKVKDATLDVRVSTMPTQHGESVVMRLLDQSANLMTLDRLGMPAGMMERFLGMIDASAGMVLVTGPTGSGKTTTLYSALNYLNDPAVKIITVEDPVEYQLEGINQVQVNAKIGLDFARVLRTALRQDPDIILVGEIRDQETAEMAFRAAMTGHQVYSTLHTNSSIGAIPRLMDLGVLPDIMAGNIIGVIAQRLMRKLCIHCRVPYEPDPATRRLLTMAEGDDRPVYQPVGCAKCENQGYRGRLAIMEIFKLDSEIDELIARRATGREIRMAAAAKGFRTLADDAISRVLMGQTSLEEISRVVDLTDRVI